MPNEIVKVLFPNVGIVNPTMLEQASENGILEIQRLVGSTGMFLRPGIFAKNIDTNRLMPVATGGGVTVSIGQGITASGEVISVITGLSWTTDLGANVNKTLFLSYETEVSDDIQSLIPTSGVYEDVATIKSQDADIVLFWATYDPTIDPYLTTYPHSIPLGQLVQVGGVYAFVLGNGHRRLALPLIPFIGDDGHFTDEFSASVDDFCSLYEFLACVGHSTRSTNNPFGLSTTDISLLLLTLKTMIYRAGIPAQDFINDDNNAYYLVTDGGSGTVLIGSGDAIDWEGRILHSAVGQSLAVTNNNTWYYLAVKYLEWAGKDSYEFTLTTTDYGQTDRVNLARVKNNGGTLSIIDERQTLLCRGYYPVQVAPGVPTDLELTTNYEDDNIHETDIDYVYGTGAADTMRERRAGNALAWIKATWTASSGDPIAYEISMIPLNNSDVPIAEQMETRRSLITTNTTPDNFITIHNIQPGIKYRIQVRSVGRPPTHADSAWCSAEDMISGIGADLTMSPITLTERYFGGNVSSGQPEAQTTTRYQAQGFEVSWVAVVGAYGYEVFATKNAMPEIDTPAQRRGVDFIWRGTQLKCFVPALDGEYWYVKARCFDSGGFPSANTTTSSLLFGDATAPSIPTDLHLETGSMDDLIPTGDLILQTVPTQPKLAYIRASWTASTDNKTGVARYDVWIAPDKQNDPGYPDETLMQIFMSYQQDNEIPPINYTFLNLRPGVKYWVMVRAVDGRGNMSDWCSPISKIAGETVSPVQPVPILQGVTNGISINWDADENALGYEVYVRLGADPGTNPDRKYLWEVTRSNSTIYNMPSSGEVNTVCVRIRPFNNAGFYGTISAMFSAEPIMVDGNTFATAIQTISDAQGIIQEVINSRRDFENVDARMLAMESAAGFNWNYVRVVAKSGGQYSSIQQAVDSIPDNINPYLIMIVHDGGDSINTNSDYDQEIDVTNKWVGFMGFGNPTIGPNYGRITSFYAGTLAGHIWLLDGIRVVCSSGQTYSELIKLGKQTTAEMPIIRNCRFWHKGTGVGIMFYWALGNVVATIENTKIITANGFSVSTIPGAGLSSGEVNRLKILHCEMNSLLSNCVYLCCNPSTTNEVYAYNSSFKTANGTSKSLEACTTGTRNLYVANDVWNVAPVKASPGWSEIYYGTASLTSNVLFNTSEIWLDSV